MKNGIINGLIAAAILSILYIIVYFVAPKMNFTFIYPFLSSTVIYLFFMIRSSNQEEAMTNRSFGFGEALIPAMICYAVVSLVFSFLPFIMIKLDPPLLEYAEEAALESIDFLANLIGDREGALIEQMEGQQEDMMKQFTSFGNYFVNWFVSLVFPGLLYGAIAAKMARKKTTTIKEHF